MPDNRSNIDTNDPADASAFFAATIEAMDEGLILLDANDRLKLINRRALDLLDLPADLVSIGTPHENIVTHLANREGSESKGMSIGFRFSEALSADDKYEFVHLFKNGLVLNISSKPTAKNCRLTIFRDITAEHNTEVKLRRSEQRYRSIVDSNSEAVCRWRPDGLLTYANEPYCRLRGISPGSVKGQKAYGLTHPDDRQGVLTEIKSLGPEKRHVEIESRIVDSQGTVTWMLWATTVFIDEHSAILGYQASGREITDRIIAEEAAREAERQLRLVIDALPVCIAYIGADGCYQMVNETYEKWFKKSREQIIGRHAKEVIGEVAFATLQSQMENVLSGNASTFEGKVPYQNAGERFVQWSYVPNFSPGGAVHGFFSVVTDLSEHLRTTRALEESENRFRRMIESSPDIILVHHDGIILFVNTAAASLLRAAKTELLGRYIDEFIDGKYFKLSPPVAELDGPVQFEELMLTRNDGTCFAVELSSIKLIFEGKPAVQLVCRDITARNTAQAQIMQSSKLASLGEIAAGMAHELAQPLNVIRMAADNGMFGIEDQKNDNGHDIDFDYRQFETIAGQTIRMAEIINHMREFARIDNEHALPLDPLMTIRRSGGFFTEMFRTENILLSFDLPDIQIEIHGQRILFEQLFVTLIQNARDAILGRQGDNKVENPQGRIDIAAEVHKKMKLILITVNDDGGGISPSLLEQIFDPFITTKPAGRGTGLGLSVAREIVNRMGGSIIAKNIPNGAQFVVSLPLIND